MLLPLPFHCQLLVPRIATTLLLSMCRYHSLLLFNSLVFVPNDLLLLLFSLPVLLLFLLLLLLRPLLTAAFEICDQSRWQMTGEVETTTQREGVKKGGRSEWASVGRTYIPWVCMCVHARVQCVLVWYLSGSQVHAASP